MRLLYTSDWHIRGDSPRARLDNYQEALWAKVAEVGELAKIHDCTAILYGGDLTHWPDAAASVVSDAIRALRKFTVPLIGISGNTHDVWGDNPATIRRTALGIIQSAGLIHLLQPGEAVMLEEGGVTVQVTGQQFHAEIDRRDRRLDYCVAPSQPDDPDWLHWRRPEARWAVHMVHGMLRTKPLPGDAPVTLVTDVAADGTAADITLSGHDHNGFGIIRSFGKTFCNPGALMRGTAAIEDMTRPVQVALLTLTPAECEVQLIPLISAAPGTEVLDRSHIERKNAREDALEEFLSEVEKGGGFEVLDIPSIVQRIADNKGVAAPVRVEALRRIEVSQEKIGAGAEEEVAV